MAKKITISDLAMTVRPVDLDEVAWAKTLGPPRIEMRLPAPSEETRAAIAAVRGRIERMGRTSLERVETAARAMLRLAPGDALDAEKARVEIERRDLSLVRRGSDVVELREGDAVRWRGRWTWEAGQATWSEEWVTPHVFTVAADVEGEVPAGTLMVLRPDGTVAPAKTPAETWLTNPAAVQARALEALDAQRAHESGPAPPSFAEVVAAEARRVIDHARAGTDARGRARDDDDPTPPEECPLRDRQPPPARERE